jgi:prepilin-type N-terminal cleavage/methylation domain-containing protein
MKRPQRHRSFQLDRSFRPDRGFTLIEVMACMLIAAALASIAVVNLQTDRPSRRLRAAVAELVSQDRLMRTRCQRLGHAGALVFDLEHGQAARVETDGDGRVSRTPLRTLGDPVRVEAVRTTAPREDDREARVDCLSSGRTRTYAVRLACGERQEWLVVSGLTGAWETIDDEQQVENLFERLGAGDDAR